MRKKTYTDLELVDYVLQTVKKIELERSEAMQKNSIESERYVDLMAFYIAQIGEQFAPDRISRELLIQVGFTAKEIENIYRMRNVVNHHYNRSDASIVLATVENNIPELKDRMKQLKEQLDIRAEKEFSTEEKSN